MVIFIVEYLYIIDINFYYCRNIILFISTKVRQKSDNVNHIKL